jgi:hypothetical protein
MAAYCQSLTALSLAVSASQPMHVSDQSTTTWTNSDTSITSIPRRIMITHSHHLITVICSGSIHLTCIEELFLAPLIQHLDISGTSVSSINVVSSLPLLRHFNCSGAQKVDNILALRLCPLEFLDISYTAVTMLHTVGLNSDFFGLQESDSTLRTFICRGTQIKYHELQSLSSFECPFELLDVRDCPNLYEVVDIDYWRGQRISKDQAYHAYEIINRLPPDLKHTPQVVKYNGPMYIMFQDGEDVDCSNSPNIKWAVGFAICQKLCLHNCPVLKDVSDLSYCSKLRWLDLSKTAIKNVSQMFLPSRWDESAGLIRLLQPRGCFLLEYLDIRGTRVTTVISLKECKELKNLYCNFLVVDVGALKVELPSLVVSVQRRAEVRSRVIAEDIDDDDDDEEQAIIKAKARKMLRQDRDRALEMEDLERQFSRCQASSSDDSTSDKTDDNNNTDEDDNDYPHSSDEDEYESRDESDSEEDHSSE